MYYVLDTWIFSFLSFHPFFAGPIRIPSFFVFSLFFSSFLALVNFKRIVFFVHIYFVWHLPYAYSLCGRRRKRKKTTAQRFSSYINGGIKKYINRPINILSLFEWKTMCAMTSDFICFAVIHECCFIVGDCAFRTFFSTSRYVHMCLMAIRSGLVQPKIYDTIFF